MPPDKQLQQFSNDITMDPLIWPTGNIQPGLISLCPSADYAQVAEEHRPFRKVFGTSPPMPNPSRLKILAIERYTLQYNGQSGRFQNINRWNGSAPLLGKRNGQPPMLSDKLLPPLVI